MITQFVKEGGSGMLLTALLGFVGLAMAIAFVRRPNLAKDGFVQRVSFAVLAVALGSTALGIVFTSRAVGICREMGTACQHDLFTLFVEGIGESFNNLVLGMIFVTLIQLTAAVGRIRAPA